MSMSKGQQAPRTVTRGFRSQAWWLMRKNRAMTIADILLTLHDGAQRKPVHNIRRWLNGLVAVGVLTRERIDDGKLTSNGSYLYQIAVDIGRKPPVLRANGEVYDPNHGNIYQPVKPMPPLSSNEVYR